MIPVNIIRRFVARFLHFADIFVPRFHVLATQLGCYSVA